MTIERGEPTGRRGHGIRAGRAGQAAAELEELLVGPVHAPYTTDALVELAPDPGAWSRRLLAVVGAVGTSDVVATIRWAAENAVAVTVVDPSGDRCRPAPADRPSVAISLVRVDRVRRQDDGSVRAGVGASWAAVGSAHRPGVVGARAAALGATLVTGGGATHELGADRGDPDLWWAHREHPGHLGVVTALVLDPRDVTVPRTRRAWSAGERTRLSAIRRRHDPAGVLG